MRPMALSSAYAGRFLFCLVAFLVSHAGRVEGATVPLCKGNRQGCQATSESPVLSASPSDRGRRAERASGQPVEGIGRPAKPGRPVSTGVPARGPHDAPVVIIEFSDFECPFCGRVAPVLDEIVQAYPNQIRHVFKHSPLPSHSRAPLAHEATLAAGAQGKFWEMHDLLFTNQQRLDADDLVRYAKQLGLDLKAFNHALRSRRYRAVVEQDLTEARGLGVDATPTFFVNGQKLIGARPLADFKKVVETQLKALAGGSQGTGDRQAIKSPEPETAVGSIVTRGPESAPVTITWFSDLESSLSVKADRLLREVMGLYPDAVRVVFRHRPLEFHVGALLAHEAALAAGEQGKFWQMHDLILAKQRALTREDLIGHAERLGLDLESFTAALDGHAYRAAVERDLAEARRREVRGTPVFFVNGRRIDGIQPLARFQDAIDAELEEARLSSQ